MSVFGTLKLRGINPTDAVKKALCHYALHEEIPSLDEVANMSDYE